MKKSICPLCGNEITDLSRHLVLVHNIKDIDHLKSLTTNNSSLEIRIKDEKPKEDIINLNIEKELIKTTFKVQGEVKIKEKIENIKKLGHLINTLIDKSDLINEGINMLINCLDHNNLEVIESSKTELINIVKNEKLNDVIKSRIQVSIGNSN